MQLRVRELARKRITRRLSAALAAPLTLIALRSAGRLRRPQPAGARMLAAATADAQGKDRFWASGQQALDDGRLSALHGLGKRFMSIAASTRLYAALLLCNALTGCGGEGATETRTSSVAACISRGIAYFKEIGSYPTLKSAPNAGRSADEVAAERCNRTTTAF
jgi:hypothetical protein